MLTSMHLGYGSSTRAAFAVNDDALSTPADRRLAIIRTSAYRAVAGSWASPALIACSGGTDSMALVLLAREALRSGSVGPFVVCHVDHMSRVGSARDAEVVRQLCSDFQLPFIATRVRSSSPGTGQSLEAFWREARYEALFRVCRNLGVGSLVSAHTRNDQVENILMRLLSGSSRLTIRGNGSGLPNGDAVQIVRPLLGTARAELQSILALAGRQPVDDPSNLDSSYRRNAVRNRLIPVIDEIYPGFESALVRFARLREADADYCDAVAADVYASVSDIANEVITIPRSALSGTHTVIASRLILLAARQLIGDTDNRELTQERVESVLQAVSGRSGALIQLPYGVRVRMGRDQVVFSLSREGT